MLPATLLVFSCLLGSVPFGFLVAKSKGVDIRTVGSGNVGATNVFRSVGKGAGILTFLLDFLKGLVPVIAAKLIAGGNGILPLLCGIAAVAGHTWSVFLKFKGGKGVATSAGLLCGVIPGALGAALLVWIAVFLVSRYVSLASVLAAAALGIMVWFLPDVVLCAKIIVTLLAIAVIVRHKANMHRLANGKELRFSFTAKQRNNASGRSGK